MSKHPNNKTEPSRRFPMIVVTARNYYIHWDIEQRDEGLNFLFERDELLDVFRNSPLVREEE
jgi:hypothetical protein